MPHPVGDGETPDLSVAALTASQELNTFRRWGHVQSYKVDEQSAQVRVHG
jgi:hypothetical protein